MKYYAYAIFALGLLATPVYAADVVMGDLIKSSGPAVYYYAQDGKRYVFPNERIYRSWFADFSLVKTVSDVTLANIPLEGSITTRPATRLVKVTDDPRVYVIAPGRVLRWINSESVALALFGHNWTALIDDAPNLSDYSVGSPIEYASQYPASVRERDAEIGIDEALASMLHGTVTIQLTGAQNVQGTFPAEICPSPLPAAHGLLLVATFNGYRLTVDEGPANNVLQTLQLRGVRLSNPDGSTMFMPWSEQVTMTRTASTVTLDALLNPENPARMIRIHALFEC